MEPGERVRTAGRMLTEPMESLAQHVARRAIELVIEALDINPVLDRTDPNRVLDKVDVNRLLDRVDVNELADRIDVTALVKRAELDDLISRSSSTIASEGVDLIRSQAVGLDEFAARWVHRLRRRRYSGPPPLRGAQVPS